MEDTCNLKQIDQKLDIVVAKVELLQEQLNKQEESNRRLETDNEVMKKQLRRMTQVEKVVIAGGWNGNGILNSVEMFSLSNGTWTPLQEMKERRREASSVVYNNHIFVTGGSREDGENKSMEKLSTIAVETDRSIKWEISLAELPENLCGHGTVVYNGRLIVIGGFYWNRGVLSDSITEVSLVPPYTKKVLATMPQGRCNHGVALFGDQILILGGNKDAGLRGSLKTVLLYDVTKNECKELATLPYPVEQMAIVKWDDDNVIVMGGLSDYNVTLKNVFMYNVKTERSHMLPDMNYARSGCVAAVVRDTVIVMGGRGEGENYLNSVECFAFDRWKELPQMHEGRAHATAVVC